MVDLTKPIDDDYKYMLEDLLRAPLREGTQRARHHQQMLIYEKVIGVEAAIVALGKALAGEEATAEASAKKHGRTKSAGNGAAEEGAFPT